eukprot:m.19476 g.19476  ORF g.19476 m.19476 type:complete len:139 (+) comp10910_c0_seq1:113-529(+)
MRFERVVVPTRFLLMLAHLIQVLHLLIQRTPHTQAAHDQDDLLSTVTMAKLDSQFVGMLSFSLLALAMAAISFFSGYTMFNGSASFACVMLHLAVSPALSYFIAARRPSDLYFYFSLFIDTPLLTVTAVYTISRCLQP